MAFRTIEISNPAELHVKNGQLEITQADNCLVVPLEDIAQIMCIGQDIRISTMALSKLVEKRVVLTTLDRKYLPTAIVTPFEGNSRQSRVIHRQIETTKRKYDKIWQDIIFRKIENQANGLALIGKDGIKDVLNVFSMFDGKNTDIIEARAAKIYFRKYYPGMNRRIPSPINSRLNYGYAVVRSAIARSLIIKGFHPAIGIHHNNQLNGYNLVDDLIEPFRPIVDLFVINNLSENLILSKQERENISNILHSSCEIDGVKRPILSAIDIMCESLKRTIVYRKDKIKLPKILPIEENSLLKE